MPPADESVAEQVVVIAAKSETPAEELPYAVTVLDVRPLASPGAGLSIAEHTLTVPGIVVRNRFNGAQGPRISIRGFGARSAFGVRGLTVVLDGIPLTLADGLAQVDLVDPDLLGRIDVLRSPAGVLYGNAAGGVLFLHSGGAADRAGEDVSVRIGEYGWRKAVVRAAETLPHGEIVAAASTTAVDGYREQAHSERSILHLATRQDVSERTAVRVVTTLLDTPLAEDPGALTAEELAQDRFAAAPDNRTYDTGEDLGQVQVGMGLTSRLTAREEVDASGYFVGRTFLGRIPFRVNEVGRTAVGTTVRGTSRPLDELQVAAAIDAHHLLDRRLTFDSDGGAPIGAPTVHQDEEVLSLGASAQVRAELAQRLLLLGGIRTDRSMYSLLDRALEDGDASDARGFGTVNGMLGATVRVADSLVAWSSYANATEAPTISELSLRPDGEAGFVDALVPQQAHNVEIGIRGERGPFRGELTAFRLWLAGELVPFSDETGRTFYRNAGRSHRTGLEVAASGELPWEIDVRAAYSLLLARFDRYAVDDIDYAGNVVPGMVPHRLGAAVAWGTGRGPYAGADLDALSSVYADDANEVRVDGQAVLALRAGWRVEWRRLRVEVGAGVENLLGAEHIDNLRVNASNGRYFEPGWPRYFHGGLTVGRTPPAG